MEALWISSANNLASFVCIQSQFNLLNRFEVEPELMLLCKQFGLGIMAQLFAKALAVGINLVIATWFASPASNPTAGVFLRNLRHRFDPCRMGVEAGCQC